MGNSSDEKRMTATAAVIAHVDVEEALTQIESDGFHPPDGGLRAWSQVVASHLISALTWGYAASFGVFQLHYEQSLGLPSSQISWIGSVQVFLTFGLCAVSGRMSDAGHSYAMVAIGCSFAVVGTFMTSLATTYWQIFLAQGVCTGIGLGLAFMPALQICTTYFKKYRSFALTLGTIGNSVGGTVFPATIQYATPKIGFPWAVRCAGFIALGFSVTACLLFKPYMPARKNGPLVEWAAFKETPYLLFSLGAFLNFYGMYFGSFYINSYARNVIGFSTVDSVNLLIITNALGIPTRPIVGYVANNYTGPINTYIVATSALSICLFGWTGVTTRTGLYMFSVAYGIALSANQGVFPAALASLTNDPKKMGTRFGMVETMASFATLAGTPTAGAILDRMHGEYLVSQLWAGGVFVGAVVVYTACRVAVAGWKIKIKI